MKDKILIYDHFGRRYAVIKKSQTRTLSNLKKHLKERGMTRVQLSSVVVYDGEVATNVLDDLMVTAVALDCATRIYGYLSDKTAPVPEYKSFQWVGLWMRPTSVITHKLHTTGKFECKGLVDIETNVFYTVI